MAKMTKVPEGALICQITNVGTRRCHPVVGECDSWKTLGVAMIRIFEVDGEDIPSAVVHPLCRKHMHAYVDEVLFDNSMQWSEANDEIGDLDA